MPKPEWWMVGLIKVPTHLLNSAYSSFRVARFSGDKEEVKIIVRRSNAWRKAGCLVAILEKQLPTSTYRRPAFDQWIGL